MRTLEKIRLKKRLGHILPEVMKKVDRALAVSLGTDERAAGS